MSASEVEFWFDFASSYSYLSAMRIETEGRSRGVAIVWKPFSLGRIARALAWESNPFVERSGYIWQDMIRQSRKHGLRWRQPSVFPRQTALALRIALLASNRPWIGAFSRKVMELNFTLDEEIDSSAQLLPVLGGLGLPACEILAEAQSEATRLMVLKQGEEAGAREIFGAPTFFVGAEMFWGDDRLLDALQFATDCRPALTASAG